jgi:hypothetical protein
MDLFIVASHPVRKMIKYNKMNYFVKGKRYEIWRGIKRFNYLGYLKIILILSLTLN